MKKKNFLGTVLVVAPLALLLSCAEEDADGTFSPRPLNFSTTVSEIDAARAGVTRVADATTANLRSMGVFAGFTHGNFDAGSSKPDFMYNQLVSRTLETAAWTYAPVKYWPDNDGDKLSFFAYAPHGASGLTFSANTKAGFPALTYTPSVIEADQTDLLAAKPLLNCTKNTGGVNFSMDHALTKVNFSIKSKMGLKVTALSVNNAPATATLTYTESGFGWGGYTGTQTFTAALAFGGVPVTANAANALPLATFFLLPDKAGATFSVTYLQDGETVAVNKTDVALPSAWGQGANVIYMLNVTKDGLTVSVTQSNEWAADGGGDEALSSKELAPGYKATDLKLGDYYYSDGTTSDGGYRKYADNTTAVLNIMPVLTDKDGNARSVVAIVFYVGKHTTDTGDYSTTGIGTSTFHGYAVALRDLGRIAWCNKSGTYNVGTSTSLGDWQGFYNQQQIEAFVAGNSADGWTMSNFPAANGCKNYSPAAPATSSGWFLLSSRQLQEIGNSSNKSVLNTNFSKAKGSTMNNYYTWTSSEDGGDYSRAHHVGITYNSTGGDYKTASFYVRPILAF